ncbi:MAG: sigma-54 dependent transcriptional regulator [Acidobacteriota bacterium]
MTDHQPTLLLVDDDVSVRGLVGRLCQKAGFNVVSCADGAEAIARMRTVSIDVAMVDLRMPHVGGLEVLRAIREAVPGCQVILMTGHATIDTAVEAIRLGALDYLTKPFDLARLRSLLAEVREGSERRRRLMARAGELAEEFEFCGMIGVSPVMQEVFSLIRRIAPHAQCVLITGETGTGKELVARALHQLGPRRYRPLVTVNCSAVVDTLFESELFGHVRGAFTGAIDAKAGLFERADGGTLLLDEIGELPSAVQAKLLRVLESGEIQRVGASDARKVDVHVFAATNRDIRDEVAAGRFRADLYYRLNVVEIHLPALAERREDIPYLTAAFVRQSARRVGKHILGITAGAERELMVRPWSGNVRELRNTIERACMLAGSELLTERELAGSARPPQDAHAGGPVSPPSPAGGPPSGPSPAAAPPASLADLEATQIQKVLAQAQGNKKLAARMLGISRRALYRKLERHGLMGSAEARADGGSRDG